MYIQKERLDDTIFRKADMCKKILYKYKCKKRLKEVFAKWYIKGLFHRIAVIFLMLRKDNGDLITNH